MKYTAHGYAFVGMFVALMLCGISADAATDFASATPYEGAGCPAGTFLDVGRGQCWSCPKSYDRFAFSAVDSANACWQWPYLDHRPAKKHRPAPFLFVCPKGQFWDPDGYCYSCRGGFIRGVASVTSDQACSKAVAARYAKAKRHKDIGCPTGTFLDIGRGDCWSCPDNWYRTALSPVDSARACTSSATNILAADTTAMCNQAIAAFAEGEKGAARLMSTIGPVIDPVLVPVNAGLSLLSSQIKAPAELDGLIETLGARLRSDVVDEVQRLWDRMRNIGTRSRLKRLLLNPRVMCQGAFAEVDPELEDLGLRPKAATRSTYVAFTISESLLSPDGRGFGIVLTVATNFVGGGGVYFSIGPTMVLPGAGKGIEVSLGAHIFPDADPDQFDEIGSFGAEVSLGAGEALSQLLKKAGRPSVGMAGSFSVSFDPELLTPEWARSSPAKGSVGFGFSKDVIEPDQVGPISKLAVGGSLDWTWKMTGW